MVPFIVSVWRRGAGSALMRYSIRACDEVVADTSGGAAHPSGLFLALLLPCPLHCTHTA